MARLSKADITLEQQGYSRILTDDKQILYYEKDGKKFRRIGHLLVEI